MPFPYDFRAYGFHRGPPTTCFYEMRPQLIFRPERVWFDAEPSALLESIRVGAREELIESGIPIQYLLRDVIAPKRELPDGDLINLEFEEYDEQWGFHLYLPTVEIGNPVSIRWSGVVRSFLLGGSQLRA